MVTAACRKRDTPIVAIVIGNAVFPDFGSSQLLSHNKMELEDWSLGEIGYD
jgi:hypothetical protein